ncbi:hypothetical protein ABBQ38_008288 [Trebouxia sp. C0009 RCD-2024]
MCGWRCNACGHKWRAAPDARVGKQSSNGCPMCALLKKRTKHPSFAECNHPLLAEWDRERNATRGNRPDNVTLQSGKQIFWLCTKCPAGQVCTAGLLRQPIGRVITEQAVHSALGRLLADATPCMRSTLT